MKNPDPNSFLLSSQNPSSEAIITSDITLTYRELKNKVLMVASYLDSQNISSGQRVGIFIQHDIEFVINIFALWQLSAIPVLLSTRLIESEILEQFDSSNCVSIITQNELLEKLKKVDIKIITSQNKPDTQNTTIIDNQITLNNPAVIIFTSGSTNKSKGVILSFDSLFNSAFNGNNLLRYSEDDRWLASLPFYHIGGFSIITRSLLFGIPLIIPDSLSTNEIAASMKKHQPTFISLVAAQLKELVDKNISPNPELKNCLIGGGFSDAEIIRKAFELGWPINIVYGSTETSSFVTALLKDELLIKPNSVGRAIPSNKIFIKDESGNEQKPFVSGEIIVQSNALMSGYIKLEETEKVLKNGFFKTGDLGYLDDDGYLFIESRKDFLISSGGENVSPLEVENQILLHPLVQEVAVFPLKDKKWGEIIAASIVLKNKSAQLTFDELKSFLRKKISNFKIPKKIFIENDLPKTDLGKIEIAKLIDRYKLTSL